MFIAVFAAFLNNTQHLIILASHDQLSAAHSMLALTPFINHPLVSQSLTTMLAGLDQLAEVAALVCHPGGAPVAPAAVPRFTPAAGSVPATGEASAAVDGALAPGAEEGGAAVGAAEEAADLTNAEGGPSAPKAAGIADKFAAAMKGANAARKSSDNVKLRVNRCVPVPACVCTGSLCLSGRSSVRCRECCKWLRASITATCPEGAISERCENVWTKAPALMPN